jgi:uncharacterized protein YxeA
LQVIKNTIKLHVTSILHQSEKPNYCINQKTSIFAQLQKKMSKKPTVEKKWTGEAFGTQASTSSVIYVFRNGEKHHKGAKITLNPKTIKTIDQLKEKCSAEVALSTGPVRKILTLSGKAITTLEEFQNGENYIAVGGEGKIDSTNSNITFTSNNIL